MELEDPEVTKNFYRSIKKMDMTVPAYFKYFQCQATKDAESTAGLYELQNKIIVAGQAYFCYLWSLTTNIVTGRACFNFSQHLTMKDPELITRYQLLRNTKGTKSVALTD